MTGAWLREEHADRAADKILDAAAAAFEELGVAGAGMAEIARIAGCSRGTLYRYFSTRRDLWLAYVNRTAREVSDRVAASLADVDDPETRLVETILRSVREVRNTPATAAWFSPGDAGIAVGMAQASEVIDVLTAHFVVRILGGAKPGASRDLRAQWLVRIIVSLLVMPGASADEERTLVTRFVAPALVPSSQRAGRGRTARSPTRRLRG